jgi:hypothetical protein
MALPPFIRSTRIAGAADEPAPKRPYRGAAARGGLRLLDFFMQPQQRRNWCWAATAVSVAAFYDPATAWTQCALANAELGRDDCCDDGERCDVPWYLDIALQRVGRLREWSASPATIEEVAAEVESGNRSARWSHGPMDRRTSWR